MGGRRSWFFFFFKQKTAYEILACWSSDVCSSDLCRAEARPMRCLRADWVNRISRGPVLSNTTFLVKTDRRCPHHAGRRSTRAGRRGGRGRGGREIGRASCRERGEVSVVAVSLKKE